MKGSSHRTLEEVYIKYWRELYVVAYRRLKSEEDVEDILQDIFLSLVQKPSVLENEGSLRAYLHQALKYKIIDFLRKEHLKASYQQEELAAGKFSLTYSDEPLLTNELELRVQEEVNRMPEKMQQVYLLSRRESLSIEQIADTLGLSNQTVKNQISSALKRLRTSLNDYAPLITFLFSCLTLA
ncbi:RNA polymerase sigma factor [Pontibacter silvestris]|uniref:RNA polymerase sigma factor n=1 Tax=Pontibacter silvestris TaxID=2305183 RepID=A0ABW4WU04_9BACT|nr:sigma-70 family RNA polymerase sigma factor [Pontibacter silvestris]MCC9138589.1 sigma-70 family RNA polymerase sigma factor [Pontibacter silvestris]